ncbi:MAG TPA: flavin reductase family protein [Ruania sp.]|nr:flavin reductase family protein [Ruania sp.]
MSAIEHNAPAEPAAPATELSGEQFKFLFRQHPAGVCVITSADAEGPYGFTATSVISVSAAPPVLAFSVASGSSAWRRLQTTETLVVNFLDAEVAHLSTQFARRGTDRFAGVDTCLLDSGEPALVEAAAWTRGRIEHRTPAGDSFLITVRALSSRVSRSGRPLVYHDRSYHSLGEHSAIE